MEQWDGKEVLRQSRQSAWNRTFPGWLTYGHAFAQARILLAAFVSSPADVFTFRLGNQKLAGPCGFYDLSPNAALAPIPDGVPKRISLKNRPG
ncbi:hypothetical protein SBA5_590071 [Candidatus Sulfotelmatomonas gaucii]|uniref:Uncharacterized protein n=1 Tax=Candidatus Sulfuritelmatomonas gaucii TaxID=2043161 RepID=A0A2N9LVZ5_9BACT|nr:hypothetical protein SBA5_590071 [Candidatus Sulfotelmatomonas gaucii]